MVLAVSFLYRIRTSTIKYPITCSSGKTDIHCTISVPDAIKSNVAHNVQTVHFYRVAGLFPVKSNLFP